MVSRPDVVPEELPDEELPDEELPEELLPDPDELPELLPEELPDEPLPEELSWIFAAPPVDFFAVPLYSLLSVAVPALPSAVRLLFFWKAITAASVATPKEPSTLPLR